MTAFKGDNVSKQTLYMRTYREKHKESYAKYQSDYKRRRRQMVYDHYGSKCECCGETEFVFLSIDHKNGGGTKHRQETGARGAHMIDWIIVNNYPDIFRVLCHNCNQAYGFYGTCPHQGEE